MKPLTRRTALASSLAGIAALGAASAARADEQSYGLLGKDKPKSVFSVISDIQGDLHDFGMALQDIETTNPAVRSSGLVINGDITPRGYDFEYRDVQKVLDANPHARNAHWVIGNHEFYIPKWATPSTLQQATWPNGCSEETLFNNFYRFTGRDKVYTEVDLGGVPALILGTEKYMHYHDTKLWDEVWMSDAQFAWLESRLAFWTARKKPVMVFCHHPLPNTVSGTRNALYKADYLQPDRLLGLFGQYKNVFFFSGHTHWDLNLSDWAVRRVVHGTGNDEGFMTVNTGAIQTLWEDDGHGGERALDPLEASGLQVEVFKDSVLLRARDYRRKQWIKELHVPLFF
ncbi:MULTISPECIES: DUF4073 domain-containing protein [Arthrobacter]|uniref:DUF4073 domain-containing protein n=2 Tax=Arthrobacter TaxID=1663 RepID=A0ABU9KLK7_9MICC|nr:DUF4073 domain-containing protein [Arthrobacter sp. YJM1]MDP5227780.1 DUF4073 domain-containing protein [Arthrobacter sp. YJM1]